MKLPQPYKCDYCGKIKGESNHWWLRVTYGPGQAFIVDEWSAQLADQGNVEHICSQECASKALSQWMSQRANAGPSQPVEDAEASAKT
jgi:hypothetical protein